MSDRVFAHVSEPSITMNKNSVKISVAAIMWLVLALPGVSSPLHHAAPLQPSIEVNGFFSADKAQRGRKVEAAVVLDIPPGFHVNSNRPLGKYAVPTTLRVEAPNGFRVGPVSFPRAVVRRFSFSKDTKEQLAVYEGKAVMRFNFWVPANQQTGTIELRARLRYQGCNDEVCFPPVTREINLPILVVDANDQVKRINSQLFPAEKKGRTRGRRG